MKYFLLFLVSVLVGVCILMQFPLPILFVVVFPFLLMLFSRKLEWGLYFLCVLIPLQYFVTPYYLGFVSQHFVWLDELVVFAMFSLVVFNKIVRKEPCNLSYIDAWVGFFVVFSIVFSLINLQNPFAVLLGLRSFLQYYLLYFVVKNSEVNLNNNRVVIGLLFFFAIIQVPIGIFQFVTWKPMFFNSLTSSYVNQWNLSYYDAVVGSFGRGAANNFGYLIAAVILFVFGLYLKLKNGRLLLLSFIMLIPFVLSQSRGAFLLLFILIIGFYWRILIFNIQKFILPFCLMVIVFLSVITFYFAYSKFDFEEFFDFEKIIKQQTVVSQGSSGRIVGLKIANDILFNQAPSFLIGTGAGSFSSTTGMFLKAPLYVSTIKKLNSDRCITESDIVPILVEFGYLGSVFFLIILASMLFKTKEILVRAKNAYLKAFAFASMPVILLFILSGFVVRAWETQYLAFYLWFLLGFLEKCYLEEKNNAS